MERQSEIPAITNDTLLRDTCDKWTAFAQAGNVLQINDSGI